MLYWSLWRTDDRGRPHPHWEADREPPGHAQSDRGGERAGTDGARVEATPTCVCSLEQDHFSVNPKQVHGQAEDLPAWCSKISTLLKSMAVLLATLGGKEIDILEMINEGYTYEGLKSGKGQTGISNSGNIGRSQSFSTREEVEKEIKQCGVSVKSLKANYEIHSQSKYEDDKTNRIYKRTRSLPAVSECSYPSEPSWRTSCCSL